MSQVVNFTAPNSSSNLVLVIEGKKLYVGDFLATNSPVFHLMLTGEFGEGKPVELTLQGPKYEEFLALLKVLHPPREEIKGYGATCAIAIFIIDVKTFEFLLKWGDFYQMATVLWRCDWFLVSLINRKDNMITLEKKLLLMDQYKLRESKKACLRLDELKNLSVLHNLLSKKECRELSDDFRAVLLENAETKHLRSLHQCLWVFV